VDRATTTQAAGSVIATTKTTIATDTTEFGIRPSPSAAAMEAEGGGIATANASAASSATTETTDFGSPAQRLQWMRQRGEAELRYRRRGPLFLVEMNENLSVRDLELEISKVCAKHVGSPSLRGGLKLFVAKTPSGAWMDTREMPVFSFLVDMSGKGVKPMESTNAIKNALDLAESHALSETAQIHVLVDLADEDVNQLMQHELQLRKEESLRRMLKECTKRGDLPAQGAFRKNFEWTDDDCGKVKDVAAVKAIVGFMGSQLYVRKEMLCVLELLREFLRDKFDTGTRSPQQFIMIGSPGTGKSCLLALICFYHAVVKKGSVVWHRHGDDRDEGPSRVCSAMASTSSGGHRRQRVQVSQHFASRQSRLRHLLVLSRCIDPGDDESQVVGVDVLAASRVKSFCAEGFTAESVSSAILEAR
jgi:hypothetical protein